MSKNILVTGGAGFLGSHLCERLLSEGHKVICVDNLYTGREENITDLLESDDFKFLNHDITNSLDIEDNIDNIYNLACPASPKHYQKDSTFTLMTSIVGIKNMLDLSVQKNATLLQASTSEVYGDPEEHPQSEEYRGNVSPIGPRACYDEGKRAAETLCFDYKREMGADVRVARIFNTYGPRMDPDDGRVVSNFITQALDGRDLTVYGDGSQTRSFCYVGDLINGLVKFMQCNDAGPINLGNPDEYTILELAKKVIQITDSGSGITYRELPEDDPTRRKPDISKAEKILDWMPATDLAEGLYKTVSYFQSYDR